MNSELDVITEMGERPTEEEEAKIPAKASTYALLNRPSPPF